MLIVARSAFRFWNWQVSFQTCWFSQSFRCRPVTGPQAPCSGAQQECFGAPASPSAAPSSHSIQEAPSSSPSPLPTRHTATPSQPAITLHTSCFLLRSPPTEEATAVFMASTFSLITSPPSAMCWLCVSQVSRWRAERGRVCSCAHAVTECVSSDPTVFIIRLVVLLLSLLIFISAIYGSRKVAKRFVSDSAEAFRLGMMLELSWMCVLVSSYRPPGGSRLSHGRTWMLEETKGGGKVVEEQEEAAL